MNFKVPPTFIDGFECIKHKKQIEVYFESNSIRCNVTCDCNMKPVETCGFCDQPCNNEWCCVKDKK